jgi:hypothetical protein
MKFHYIHEGIEAREMDVDHVGTHKQLTDILTQALRRTKFIERRQKIGVCKIVIKQQIQVYLLTGNYRLFFLLRKPCNIISLTMEITANVALSGKIQMTADTGFLHKDP